MEQPHSLEKKVANLIALNKVQSKLLKAYQDLNSVIRMYIGEQEKKGERDGEYKREIH